MQKCNLWLVHLYLGLSWKFFKKFKCKELHSQTRPHISERIGKAIGYIYCFVGRYSNGLAKHKASFTSLFAPIQTFWRNKMFHLLECSHISKRFEDTKTPVCNGIHRCSMFKQFIYLSRHRHKKHKQVYKITCYAQFSRGRGLELNSAATNIIEYLRIELLFIWRQ